MRAKDHAIVVRARVKEAERDRETERGAEFREFILAKNILRGCYVSGQIKMAFRGSRKTKAIATCKCMVAG